MKASDIADCEVLFRVRACQDRTCNCVERTTAIFDMAIPGERIDDWTWRNERSHDCCRLFLEDHLRDFPSRVVLAKCRSLIRRELMTGCACGCRGDFEITGKGRAYLDSLTVVRLPVVTF